MATPTITYILASAYRFSAEGVAEVSKRFECTPEGADAVCAYDAETETFYFECDRKRGERTSLALHQLLERYIEEESIKEVVFENPKVERIDTAFDKPIEWVDPRGLISLDYEVDNFDGQGEHDNPYGNVCSTAWRPKETTNNLTGMFTPALVGALSGVTDCIFYIDQEKGEIKVTSSTKQSLERAETKLDTLERQMLHKALGSKTTHLIETEKEVGFILRFLILRKMGRTLRTTLLAHDSPYTPDLHNFYVVRLLKLDVKSQQYVGPKTKLQLIELATEDSTASGLWDDFKFNGIGKKSDNRVAVTIEPEAARILADEALSGPESTIRKADMVSQWVQEGSSEVLNPFLPIQDGFGAAVSLSGRSEGPTSNHTALSGADIQPPNKSPSPRKRFGKVRKPKGGGTNAEPLEKPETLREGILDLQLTDQTVMTREELQADPETVYDVVTGKISLEELAEVSQARKMGAPPEDHTTTTKTSIIPPEILPPFLSPITADVSQDRLPDEPPLWEKQHAHANLVGRLVDISTPSTTLQELETPPGYEPSFVKASTERRLAPAQQLVSLLDAPEEEYQALDTPLRSVGLTAQPLAIGSAIVPSKKRTPTLRIVNFTQTPKRKENSAADSASSKTKSSKGPVETLQTSDEVQTRKFRHTMDQQRPAPKKERSRNDESAKESRVSKPNKSDFTKLNHVGESLLGSGLYFRGEVKLEVQIGRMLIDNVPNQLRKTPFATEDWSAIFVSKIVSEIPSTIFTNMLTTAMQDVLFIRDLTAPGGIRMFDQHPSERRVTYELNCVTKEGDEINVVVDETANYHIEKPYVPLGAINWYYPKRTWDAKALLTGIPYIADTYELAVKAIVDSLYIPDGLPLLDIVTKTISKDLRIQIVTLRRQNRYSCVARPTVALCITEVQDLCIERLEHSTELIRARAKSPADMVRDNRLWYEVSLSSSVAEEKFKENLDLELGDFASWTPKEIVEAGVLEDLSLVARDVVTRIDNVGYSNKGPRGGPSDGAVTTVSTANPEEAPGFW